MSMPRVVVYLGASSPVHVTHTKLVRSLLDEGFDKVFVFLLYWTPDRAGISAEAGAEQLRKWLMALPAADRAKVDLQVVKGEGEGAKKMRAALGADASPEVEVCFSQKYSGQTEKINSNWMPLYLAEFPKAKPRFLTDEIDPGGPALGTPKFVEAVQAFRAAKGTAGAAAATAALDKWRPEQETADGWSAYILGMLSGANGDPFYAPAELATLQSGFFGDSEMVRVMDSVWRNNKIPNGAAEYFKNPSNYGTFWHKLALASDTELFKKYCLRAQGVVVPSALAAMPPVSVLPTSELRSGSKPFAVLAAAAMHSTAERLAAHAPSQFEYHGECRRFLQGHKHGICAERRHAVVSP